MNPWVRTVLVEHPKLVFCRNVPTPIVADSGDPDDDQAVYQDSFFPDGDEMKQITTPRTIEGVSDWLNIATREELATYLGTETTTRDEPSTLLQDIIESYVGNTMFTTHLVAAISHDLASGGGAAVQPRVEVPRPAVYASLKSQTNVTDLESVISQTDTAELSSALLFALKEGQDNSRLITLLAKSISRMENEHTQTLIRMVAAAEINFSNLEAFLDSDAPLADSLRAPLAAFV
jgi:hypothetical protein